MHHSLFRTVCACLVAGLMLAAGGARIIAQDDHAEGAHAETHADEHHDAAHAAGGHGGVDYNKPPIDPTPEMLQLFVFSLLLFGVFLLAARSLVWKPLISALDEREGRINVAYADAETAKAEAARLLSAHDAKMAEVQEQVKGIVAAARQQADAEKAQIIASAEAEAKALRDRALDEIRRAREEATAGLLATVDRQVGLATEHVLGHRLN
jgi:F-type H+-transporting ATPase subunit b